MNDFTGDPPRQAITLTLAPGSLERLLAGEFTTRVWLTEHDDGYRLNASSVGNHSNDDPRAASTIGLLRALTGGNDEFPLPDADELTLDQEQRWRSVFDSLPGSDRGPSFFARLRFALYYIRPRRR